MADFQAVIFDFDGTLVDSGAGVINSVLYALHKYGIPENDREKLRYFIGPPLFDSFRDLYGVSDADADLLISYYRERYRNEGILESIPYDGIPELLHDLKAAGITTAVCSSKPAVFVEKIADSLGFLKDLDHISAVSFQDKNADKTPLLQRALDLCHTDGDLKKIAMVGDRHFDITAAVNLGVTAVGVSYGFGSRRELAEAGADRIADDVARLRSLLMKG